MNRTELVVGQIYVLEALADEGVAVDLVNVAVAQVQRNDIVVGIAVRPKDLNKGVVAEVERIVRVIGRHETGLEDSLARLLDLVWLSHLRSDLALLELNRLSGWLRLLHRLWLKPLLLHLRL